MNTVPSRQVPATLIPGDGIGPEVTQAAVEVLEALGSPFTWDIQQGGLAAIAASSDPLPQATLESIRRTRLALKGPLTTPVAGGSGRSTCGCVRNSASLPIYGPHAR